MGEPEWKRDLLGLPSYLIVAAILRLPISLKLWFPGSKLGDIFLPRYGDWIYRDERREASR